MEKSKTLKSNVSREVFTPPAPLGGRQLSKVVLQILQWITYILEIHDVRKHFFFFFSMKRQCIQAKTYRLHNTESQSLCNMEEQN